MEHHPRMNTQHDFQHANNVLINHETIEPLMIMIAETAFEMTVHIICESIASDNFITIFCKMIKQTLMIFLEVFNMETSDRIMFT
jgi:hypothetical protein